MKVFAYGSILLVTLLPLSIFAQALYTPPTTDSQSYGSQYTQTYTNPSPTQTTQSDPVFVTPTYTPQVVTSGVNPSNTSAKTAADLGVTPLTQNNTTQSSSQTGVGGGKSQYTPLESVKLPNGKSLFNPDITSYLQNIYSFGIAIAGALAVIVIVVAGIEYMMSDAFTTKADAIGRIKAAFYGLGLALGSYVLLYTISPELVKLKFDLGPPVNVPTSGTPTTPGVIGPGAGSITGNYANFALQKDADGNLIANPSRVAIDTDGIGTPGFYDSTRQSQTAYQPGGVSLDATTQNYVVVPQGSNIPLGTKVLMTNNETGKTIEGIVGDVGPANNGLGEMSLHAAQELGAWSAPMGNSAKQINVSYKFMTAK